MRLLAACIALAACGGGGDSSDSSSDAKVFMDAPAPMIDAPPAQMGIGQPCTPGSTPQGDCPAGFECLMLNGASGAWCSKTCMRGAGMDMCSVGYVGPGAAQCIWDVMNGMTTRQFCGIVCMDTTGSCPAAKCNGTCPAPQQCTQNLMNAGG